MNCFILWRSLFIFKECNFDLAESGFEPKAAGWQFFALPYDLYNLVNLAKLFFMLVLLRRTSFLTTFYGLYFSHLTHYISQIACWASESSFHVLCSPPVLWLAGTPQASVSMLWAWVSHFHQSNSNYSKTWLAYLHSKMWVCQLPYKTPQAD